MNGLKDNIAGGYRFLPGIPAFSEGAIAMPGHAIVHARLHRPLELLDGYAAIKATLDGHGRPLAALCGVELRIHEQMQIDAFRALNRNYIEHLRDGWGLFIDGINPIPRCNLALTVNPVPEPMLHGFSFTAAEECSRAQFVTSGVNDAALVYGPDVFRQVASGDVLVRTQNAPEDGDSSPATVERRLRFVLVRAAERLAALGVAWDDATQIEVYLGRPLGDLLERVVLPEIGAAGQTGLRWFAGLAPFIGPEAELDVRGFVREIVLDLPR